MSPGTKLYLAGPITGLANYNRIAFEAAEKRLANAGYIVHSPMHMIDLYGTDEDYSFYMKECTKLLLECDGVAVLPAHYNSIGTVREIMMAQWFEIPIGSVDYWTERAVTAKIKSFKERAECQAEKNSSQSSQDSVDAQVQQ